MSVLTTAPRVMSKMRRNWMDLLLLAVLALVLQWLAMDPTLNIYDEGGILEAASLINAGRLPYADFWTMYGPGHYYLVAGAFRLFGEHVMVGRLIDFCVRAIIVCSSYSILLAAVSRLWALAGAFAVLLLLIWVGYYGFPVFSALACSVIAMLLLARRPEASGRSSFAIGVCCGLSAVFRLDIGFYTALIGVASHVMSLRQKSSGHEALGFRPILSFLAGIAITGGPVAVALFWTVPAIDIFRNLFSIPAFVYPHVRSLPFPGFSAFLHGAQPLSDFLVYVPLLACLQYLFFVIKRGGFDTLSRSGHLSALLAAGSLLFYVKGLVRVSPLHMSPSLVMSILLIVVLISCSKGYFEKGMAWLGGVALMILMAIPLYGVSTSVSHALEAPIPRLCRSPELPRARCIAVDSERAEVVRYIVSNSSPKDFLYVGAGRHDKLFVNDISLYFLSNRPPATRWYDLHPGVQTTSTIQNEMIADFEKNKPKLIVIDRSFDGMEEANASRTSSGVTLLDSYIGKNYAELYRIGSMQILGRH